MDSLSLYMIIGFVLCAYSVVANDAMQTLGTFISSNQKRPWWVLWLYATLVLVVTVVWSYVESGGVDATFGRATSREEFQMPASMGWAYIVAPVILIILTRFGLPVSTSFLVLTTFSTLSLLQRGLPADRALETLKSMMLKSFAGYALALAVAFVAYGIVVTALERRYHLSPKTSTNSSKGWVALKWVATGFLWSMWLVQDLVNIFIYLPRKLEPSVLAGALVVLSLFLAYIFRQGGGPIQRVIAQKSNSSDVRSAALIDIFFGLLLLFFKFNVFAVFPDKLPMSTTWVFLGLLAGREIALSWRIKRRKRERVLRLLWWDLRKALIAVGVSLLVVLGMPRVIHAVDSGEIERKVEQTKQNIDKKLSPKGERSLEKRAKELEE